MDLDIESDILEFKAPHFSVDLIIEDNYVVPIKIEK